MKKILLVLTILILAGLNTYSQVFVGPKIGFSKSKWLKEYTDFEGKAYNGYNLGLGFGVEVKDKLLPFYPKRNPIAFEVDLLYESRGMKYTHISGNYDFEIKTNYAVMPIMVKFSFETLNDLFVNLDFGSYTAFWTTGEWTFGDSVNAYNPLPFHWTTEDKIEFDSRFQNRWEWGLLFGGELEYNLGSFSVLASVRKNWALTSAFNEDDDIKNRILEISFGVMFHL